MIRTPIKTTQWIKNKLPGAQGESERESLHKAFGPTLGSYKGAVVFALVMFQKCSVFTSQFQTEDREGRKHLLPVEEVHFLENKRRLHTETARLAVHQNSKLEQARGRKGSGGIYFGNL